MKRFVLFVLGVLLMITMSGCATTTRSAYNGTTYYSSDSNQYYSGQNNGNAYYNYQYADNTGDSTSGQDAYYSYAMDKGSSTQNAMYSLASYVYDNDQPQTVCDLSKLKTERQAKVKSVKAKKAKYKKVRKAMGKVKAKRVKGCGCKLRHPYR